MPLFINLRHLEGDDLKLQGELPADELNLELRDDLIQARNPLLYDLEVQQLETSLLVRGSLSLTLFCQCVRCLNPFELRLDLKSWTLHLPLEGEEKVEVSGDFVDLTPHIREDILLEFPQHPLCAADCGGLLATDAGKLNKPDDSQDQTEAPSTWAELDKLKF